MSVRVPRRVVCLCLPAPSIAMSAAMRSAPRRGGVVKSATWLAGGGESARLPHSHLTGAEGTEVTTLGNLGCVHMVGNNL